MTHNDVQLNISTDTFVHVIPATSCLLDGRFLSKLFSPTLIIMATMGLSAQPNRSSVYVGNIPYQTTEDAIGNYFTQAGQVTNVRIAYDRETGRPKGFGFCEFSDEAGAQNAVNTLNGADFNGRSLRVNWANKN
ncbi:hypothetical protein ANCCAN_13818 [Ancylostoma caninum]|uniref:RRM domain-containing protein n=1 Tax=Ancylostoma caninum TaxID=29170 RepID=A0A368G754_ANCCA|nr:hypothetical protein ANCCAN_13818 [Ancylostoma caninum]